MKKSLTLVIVAALILSMSSISAIAADTAKTTAPTTTSQKTQDYSIKVVGKSLQIIRGGKVVRTISLNNSKITLLKSKDGGIAVQYTGTDGKLGRLTLGTQKEVSVRGKMDSLTLSKDLPTTVSVDLAKDAQVKTVIVNSKVDVTVSSGAKVTDLKVTVSGADVTAEKGSTITRVEAKSKGDISGVSSDKITSGGSNTNTGSNTNKDDDRSDNDYTPTPPPYVPEVIPEPTPTPTPPPYNENDGKITTAAAFKAALDRGDTNIQLGTGTFEMDSIWIYKPNTVINGNGPEKTIIKIKSSPTYHGITVATNESGSSTTDTTYAQNVTLSNFSVTGSNKYGIQYYNGATGNITNVTSYNNVSTGLLVNASTVTATNFKTHSNGWGGVEVAYGLPPVADTPAPSLILNGYDFAETPKIYADSAAGRPAPEASWVTGSGLTFQADPINKQKAVWINSPTLVMPKTVAITVGTPLTDDINGMVTVNNNLPTDKINVALTGGGTVIEKAQFKITVTPPTNGKLQLIAQDTADNYYNVATTGVWGPDTGFEIAAGNNANTEFFIVADTAGSYTVKVELVDLGSSNKVLSTAVGVITVNSALTPLGKMDTAPAPIPATPLVPATPVEDLVPGASN